ncbi:phosphotransferase enzyme family protein [Paenibacillus crassostreae]|uniref:Aminoglycoside phosphotransferase domain-containing protein n=1 Tax=Paenibacillus crassostreae TaxID=1763538 RepID=A0A167FFW6_9BACL|nr:phosphotransferase [Paenibacillus crassostreae]AOZ94445.1 hypothetical protein LPB68_21075 [Paenibacillus crassostreae]OAB76517.1 hypothetical protein PNBC_03665 [Paenibacillus crassostreae]
MLDMPVTHAIISSDALISVVEDEYEIGTVSDCHLLGSGLNDTYTVKSSIGTYILRIYKTHWRTLDDITFEVELLKHLQNNNIPVSYPITNINGNYWFGINAPEGERYAVLYSFAEGKYLDTEESAILYGRESAKMHISMDDFKPTRERFMIDLYHLLDQPLASINKALAHRPNDISYLKSLSDLLRNRIESISNDLEWGICHGDLHGGNVHFCDNGTLTHFDFDCGGYGWRAYDISVFQWAKVRGKPKEQFENNLWDKYLESYLEFKQLGEGDLQAIPLFIAIREIWLMGLHTGSSHIWGNGWQNDHYFDTNLQFLRDWCEVHSIM